MTLAHRLLLLFALAARSTSLFAQKGQDTPAVVEAGRGPETYVLLSGVVGGVAGFRRLEARLLEQGYRVIVIDPFHLSLNSVDVSFAAMAQRVDAALTARGVTSARMVGHSHGAGVMLRVAAMAPERVTALYFLDVGALASARTERLSASVRLAPIIARVPGGRRLIRERLLQGLRQNAGRHEWLDAETQRAYTEPMLDGIGRVVAMAVRLCEAREPDSLASLVSRIRVPVTVILGDVPHPSQPGLAELEALAPLGTLVRIERLPGVAHFPHEEAPDDVARFLLPPLRTVARAADGGR